MQIRELNLKELDRVYPLMSQLYPELSYQGFEDLIYDMRYMDYKMIGVCDREELISYAGIIIQTTFKDNRHLKVLDMVTSQKYDSKKYNNMMKEYLEDYSRMAMCKSVIF